MGLDEKLNKDISSFPLKALIVCPNLYTKQGFNLDKGEVIYFQWPMKDIEFLLELKRQQVFLLLRLFLLIVQ